MTAFPEFERMEPIANIGDRVASRRHGVRIFEVLAFSHEFQVDSEYVYQEIFYDLQCVRTGEFILADQFDITVIERKGRPIEYLPGVTATVRQDDVKESENIDDLLDELRDALALREMFGDHEDDDKKDRKIALKICEIKAKLKDVIGYGEYK